MDEDRLDGTRDSTFSKLTSVVGDDMRLAILFVFHLFMVLNREPKRLVNPRSGESDPSCFLYCLGTLVSPSLRHPRS
jgi:hypothetical protein